MIIGIGAVLFAFAGICHLVLDVGATEQAGTVQGATGSSGNYWFALIPAGLAVVIGAWLVLARDNKYENYDLTRQQT